jgi:ribose transport system permease protein
MKVNFKSVKDLLSEWYMIVVLFIIWGAFTAISPAFSSVPNIVRVIIFSTPLLAVTLSQNIVILVRGFDLTVGSLVSLMTAILSVLMTWSVVGSIAIAFLVGGLVGLVNGVGVTKLNVNPFLMTLSMMFVVDGITLTIRPSPGGYIDRTFASYMMFNVGGIAIGPIVAFVGLAIFGALLLEKRHLGRLIYAIGDSEEKAFLRGINVQRIKLKAYIMSGLFATFGGLYVAAQALTGDPALGSPLLFASIAAVLFGGTSVTGGVGRFPNTCAAVLILGSITSFLFYQGWIVWYRYIINGALLITAAIVQRYTALGRR